LSVREKDQSSISLGVTLLALPSIGVFFLADVLGMLFRWELKPVFGALPAEFWWQDGAARMPMLAAALAVLASAYLTALCFVTDMKEEFGPDVRRWLSRWFGGGVIFGTLWVVGTLALAPPAEHDFVRQALGIFGATPNSLLPVQFAALTILARLALMLAAGMVITGGMSCLAVPLKPLDDAPMRRCAPIFIASTGGCEPM